MNMIANMLSGFVDKEQITKDYITDALELVATEFNLNYKQVSVMIQPTNAEFDFKMYVIELNENRQPKKVLRELTVKELVKAHEEQQEG